ncbi:ABC transporter substrate-binding protein [Agrococcus sp. ARC_14]|uniref:ABC transporter substrate-binding protein n=1 Tax=Agrococcus sp. ARC_14 TaxID=2919927 RepID=UPI001F05EA04|nr:ABC transporter substrate-binding protein [Agrococcus sp. ARC_14]MCH1882037.1 ABC transporter substrate-binding protein [Agrococcus sp. ARC_14]
MRSTRRGALVALPLAGLLLAGRATASADPDSTEAAVDYDALSHEELVELATEEGAVTVYAFTSRIASVEEAFQAEYPGIDVTSIDISSTEMITRLATEHEAGSETADVAYLSDAPVVIPELVETGILHAYVPERLTGVLAEEHQTPLLAQRLSTKILMYNEEAYPNGTPVTNLWQLTTPEWTGRVVLVDPNVRGDYLDLATEMSLRADEMAAAYEELVGEPLVLDEGVADAGQQFMADLYANDAVLVDDTDAVNAAIGTTGQETPPVGFTSYSDRRDNEEEGWALQAASGVAPANGIVFPALLGITENVEHPAAARLMIDFLMGDDTESGGPGFEPFAVAGDYPTRSDVAAHEDALPLEELGAWSIDPEATVELRDDTADFLLTIQ